MSFYGFSMRLPIIFSGWNQIIQDIRNIYKLKNLISLPVSAINKKKIKGSGLNRLTENNSIIQQKQRKQKGIFDIIDGKQRRFENA